MNLQKHFFAFLHIPPSFNLSWTSAFLTPSLHVQVLLLNSSLLPPSVYFIFHMSSVSSTQFIHADFCCTWLTLCTSEQTFLVLWGICLWRSINFPRLLFPSCTSMQRRNIHSILTAIWRVEAFYFHCSFRNKMTDIWYFLCCYLTMPPDVYRDCKNYGFVITSIFKS